MNCWLARFDEKERPCAGRTQKAHLLEKQTLKREVRSHAAWIRGEPEWPDGMNGIWDERLWIPACERHHSLFDHHMIAVPRSALPASTEELAEQLGLGWYLDRRFGIVASSEPAVERNKPSEETLNTQPARDTIHDEPT